MLAGLLGQATAGRGSRDYARRLGCENVILRRRSLPTLSHGQDPLVILKHRLPTPRRLSSARATSGSVPELFFAQSQLVLRREFLHYGPSSGRGSQPTGV